MRAPGAWRRRRAGRVAPALISQLFDLVEHESPVCVPSSVQNGLRGFRRAPRLRAGSERGISLGLSLRGILMACLMPAIGVLGIAGGSGRSKCVRASRTSAGSDVLPRSGPG